MPALTQSALGRAGVSGSSELSFWSLWRSPCKHQTDADSVGFQSLLLRSPGPAWPGSPARLQTKPEAGAALAVPCTLCPPRGRTIPKAWVHGVMEGQPLLCPALSPPTTGPLLHRTSQAVLLQVIKGF